MPWFCRLLLCVLAQVLAGCVSAPVVGPVPQAVPEGFRERAVAGPVDPALAATPLPPGGWWQVFDDPQLDALVEQLTFQNASLQQAAARVAQAAAAWRASGAAGQPQLGTSLGASRQVGPLVNATGDQGSLFTLNLNLQYEVDLLQRVSRSEQAAALDLQVQRRQQRQLQLMLQAELTQAWLSWSALQLERPLLDQALAVDRDRVALAERRQRAGLGTAADVRAAQAELRADQIELQQLDRRLATLAHALALLVGDTQQVWPAAAPRALPPLPVIPAGLPSRMLQRRADVAAAEQAVQAASLRLGLARDAWFPQLALTANAGLASAELGQWLKAAARSAGLGLLLALPGLDGGRRDAAREGAAAALDLAAAEHRERVLTALRDVDDQLAALRTLAAETGVREAGLQDAERDAERARSLRERGLAGDADGLAARRQALQQRRHLLQAQAAQRLATVGLVRALGGGWDTPSNAPRLAAAR